MRYEGVYTNYDARYIFIQGQFFFINGIRTSHSELNKGPVDLSEVGWVNYIGLSTFVTWNETKGENGNDC
jgi:hypothetical protein